jgi:uncharacterized protein HemY
VVITFGNQSHPTLNLALKKKQPPQIEKKMMEEFKKVAKQGAGIKELLKQLLDEAVSNLLSMTRMEESMHKLRHWWMEA